MFVNLVIYGIFFSLASLFSSYLSQNLTVIEIYLQRSLEETIDPKEEPKPAGVTLADMAARMPVLREEIRTGMGHIITRGDEVIAIGESGNLTPDKVKWLNEQIREINKEWKDLLFDKFGLYEAYKSNLEGRHPFPLAEGGEFYELTQRLPFFVAPRDFNYIWLGDD